MIIRGDREEQVIEVVVCRSLTPDEAITLARELHETATDMKARKRLEEEIESRKK